MNIDFSYLDKKLISSLDESPLGLANGKMGFCLYFFVVSRMEQNNDYEKIANKLIDDIFEKVPTLLSVDVHSGLAGIGLGIHFLIKKKFVKGNVNTVLTEIDDEIFKELSTATYYETVDSLTLIHLLYYWYIRLKEQKEGCESQWLYQELIIQLLNKLYEKVDSSFCEASIVYSTNYFVPPFFYVLSKLYCLNFYN
jgi:lantibiotic modifying enzyme